MVTAPPTAPALALSHLNHHYEAHGTALRVLDDVTIEVSPGEFVALVGPSGCGKSTLLRAAAGLLRPVSGEVAVLGRTPEASTAAREVGLVTQDPGLLPWLTVAANVAVPFKLAGGTDVGPAVAALLDRVGIGDFAGYRPRELSGGMRQRVALARALALAPRLLLMDEPFGALDELSREELRYELLDIWQRDRASVLFVTHSIREAVLLADRVVVLSPRPGRVVADIEVPLARPRALDTESSSDFLAVVARVRAGLTGAPPLR